MTRGITQQKEISFWISQEKDEDLVENDDLIIGGGVNAQG